MPHILGWIGLLNSHKGTPIFPKEEGPRGVHITKNTGRAGWKNLPGEGGFVVEPSYVPQELEALDQVLPRICLWLLEELDGTIGEWPSIVDKGCYNFWSNGTVHEDQKVPCKENIRSMEYPWVY